MNRPPALLLNAVLGLFVSLVLAGTWWGGRSYLSRAAEQRSEQTARMLIDAASAVRDYTVTEIKPLLEPKYAFAVQSVSSYAAQQTIGSLLKQFPRFSYREATLNPTNPEDRAVDWEPELVRLFRQDPNLKEMKTRRASLTGDMLVVARPLKVTQGACLDCHSTPSRAPAEMTSMAKYRGGGGYGWTLNEVVGAQIVTVPIAAETDSVDRDVLRLVGLVGVACAVLLLVVNVLILRSASASRP